MFFFVYDVWGGGNPKSPVWGKEHDIIVDNKSATGKIKIYFFSRIKNVASKKAFGVILAAILMWAVEPVLAKVEMKLSGWVYIGIPKRSAERNS